MTEETATDGASPEGTPAARSGVRRRAKHRGVGLQVVRGRLGRRWRPEGSSGRRAILALLGAVLPLPMLLVGSLVMDGTIPVPGRHEAAEVHDEVAAGHGEGHRHGEPASGDGQAKAPGHGHGEAAEHGERHGPAKAAGHAKAHGHGKPASGHGQAKPAATPSLVARDEAQPPTHDLLGLKQKGPAKAQGPSWFEALGARLRSWWEEAPPGKEPHQKAAGPEGASPHAAAATAGIHGEAKRPAVAHAARSGKGGATAAPAPEAAGHGEAPAPRGAAPEAAGHGEAPAPRGAAPEAVGHGQAPAPGGAAPEATPHGRAGAAAHPGGHARPAAGAHAGDPGGAAAQAVERTVLPRPRPRPTSPPPGLGARAASWIAGAWLSTGKASPAPKAAGQRAVTRSNAEVARRVDRQAPQVSMRLQVKLRRGQAGVWGHRTPDGLARVLLAPMPDGGSKLLLTTDLAFVSVDPEVRRRLPRADQLPGGSLEAFLERFPGDGLDWWQRTRPGFALVDAFVGTYMPPGRGTSSAARFAWWAAQLRGRLEATRRPPGDEAIWTPTFNVGARVGQAFLTGQDFTLQLYVPPEDPGL